MRVKIATDYDYAGKDEPSVESFCLEVESDIPDTPDAIAAVYLRLRKTLKEGIKEEG